MTKTCTRCKRDKPLTEFVKCSRAKDGLAWECKDCKTDRARDYYAGAGGEKMRTHHRRWLADNKEHVQDYGRRYNAGEKGSGRGAYERISKLGIRREDFATQEEFANALNRADAKGRAARAKFFVDELKRQPCTDCGQTFDPVCMDFDHLGDDKTTEVGKMVGKGLSLETILREIAKCELVCSNCHRLRTKRRAEERRLTLQNV